ncbi:hypothetical protein BUALT_Bualt03G0116800 [Buddleja alternifolia]|uniref:Uncharacterized protein n=1 Tax=Buddleja alternifolia TaxID=168488 RepID=A0AAV6XV90_9LAMI|nr:hypothetical protein BUALT_Bualt03G0116800 [Buddleja alternifolia]
MKITVERSSAQQIRHPKLTSSPSSPSDLPQKHTFPRKPPRRKTKTSGVGARVKRESSKRGSRPETPLLRWKFGESNSLVEEKPSGEVGRRSGRKVRAAVSARKLGAALWPLHLPEFHTNGGQIRLGLQPGGDHFGGPIHCPHVDRIHSSSRKDVTDSPRSVSGPKNGLLHKFEPSFQFSNSAMEGATKWDPIGWKVSDEPKQTFGQPKELDQRAREKISALEAELEQARGKINELENDRQSSKKKLEQFLRKLSEERAAWKSREHEKIRAVIDDMKADMAREKKNRQRLEIVNSKLLNELADAKLSAKRYLQEYERERKARELIEDVCDELAKEIGEDKAEVEALKSDSNKVWEEVEEERKMLQMAEVWREERVQMKLVDAKVMLEEKYSQMNRIIEDLECFLDSRTTIPDLEEMKKAELLRQVAGSVNMQDIREMTYEPPNDIFSVFEDNFAESNIHTVSPEVKQLNKDSGEMHSNVYMDQSDEAEEDGSEWETVSHQGSSYSPDGSHQNFRVSNVSRNGGEETPIMEISEVGPTQTRQLKKVSSISRLWRSYPSNGDNYKIRLSNGRLSNGVTMPPDCGSGKDGYSVEDLGGEWSSPDSGNPHMNRGMKGCIEWPRGAPKSSLKARLMEARMDSQKIQLRQVLKQKI